METDQLNRDIIMKNPPSIGIAFGGGAARCFFHIGVLEALSDENDERLMPELIAGTSVGSIIGALYASGLSIESIKTATEKFGWSQEVVDVSQSITDTLHNLTGSLLPGSIGKWLKDTMKVEFDQNRGGFLSSKGSEHWINRLIHPKKSFLYLDKKLAIVATEIEKNERVIFTSPEMGKHIDQYMTVHQKRFIRSRIVDSCPSIATAVRSSSAVPIIFENIKSENLRLADGGIVDQVPVEIARAMGADIVIGISLGFAQFFEKPNQPHQSLSKVLEVMSRERIVRSLSKADIAIEIPGIEKTSLIDMQQRDTLIGYGRAAMKAKIQDLIGMVDDFECTDERA